MRVVLVIPAFVPSYGGPYYVVAALARHLAGMGHAVEIWTSDIASIDGSRVGAGQHRVQAEQLAQAGILLRRTCYWFHYHWASFRPFLATWMGRELRSRSVEKTVVHICGFRDGWGLAAARCCFRQGIPFVWEPMGMALGAGKSLRKKAVFDRLAGAPALRKACTVIATSPVEERDQVQAGIDKQQIVVRSNGTDPVPEWMVGGTPASWRAQARARLGLSDTDLVNLYLGRINHRKGLAWVASQLAAVPDGGDLYLVGPDEQDGTLDAVRQLLPERCHGVGSVDAAQRWDWFAAADRFLLASPYGENFALVALESVCAGTPVLLSPAVGFGGLMPAGCGHVLRLEPDAWQACLRQPGSRLSQPLVQQVREDYSWATIAHRQERIYTDVLAEGRA